MKFLSTNLKAAMKSLKLHKKNKFINIKEIFTIYSNYLNIYFLKKTTYKQRLLISRYYLSYFSIV